MILCHHCATENDDTTKHCSACLVPLRSRVSASPAASDSDAHDPYARVERNPKPTRQGDYQEGATNPHGLPALICGILGILCCGFLAIPAIIIGHLGLKFAREQENDDGKSLSLSGLILGYIGLAIMVGTFIFVMAGIGQGILNH